MKKNTHWIPKFLTRPWEYSPGKMKYFSFIKREFFCADSKTLFAENMLFNEEQEVFFNKYFETPLAEIFKNVPFGDVKLKKWKSYRAIVLFILCIIFRSLSKMGLGQDRRKLTELSYAELDQLVHAVEAKYRILKLDLNFQGRLCFPESGVFPILGLNTDLKQFGYLAVPISGNTALAMGSGGDDQIISEMCEKAHVHNFSVGTSALVDRIVIHPDLLKEYTDEKLQPILETQRKQNDEYINSINRLNAKIKDFEDFLRK